MEPRPYRWRTAVLLIVSLCVGIFIGFTLDRQTFNTFALPLAPGATTETTNLNTQLIQEAWNIINREYVDRQAINSQTQTYGAISGMVDSLGDTGHTRFMTPEMKKAEQNYTAGSFEGIGAEVEMRDNHVTIVAPMDGSPAQKAGIKSGDIIVKVNGASVEGKSLSDVVSLILGPAGTQVTLAIIHQGSNTEQDVTITRARIVVHNVTWQMLPGTTIAHVRVAAFSENISKDLADALTQAKSQGATGIILDLRNNPGGLLNEAVGVTSQFLNSGDVLEEKDASGNIKKVAVVSGGVATNIPLVVLINQGTASAAEIVSGAIQDAHRGQLVGEKTFGTGTVLQEFDLSDGSALLLAIEEWLTPSGRVIWHQGIAPDKLVTLPSNINPLTPEGERSMNAQQLSQSGDAQLLEAIKLLKGN